MSTNSSSTRSFQTQMPVTPITPTHAHDDLPSPYDDLPPILTITPPSLPTFPPSPVSPTTEHISTSKPIPSVPACQSDHSLQAPLGLHLALLHPQTPKEIIKFIASHLVSPERPYGHDGDCTPFWEWCGDLSTAGLALEARKGCEQKEDGQGREIDRKLQAMYAIARKSWVMLQEKAGEGGSL